jgi:hypothetical protein
MLRIIRELSSSSEFHHSLSCLEVEDHQASAVDDRFWSLFVGIGLLVLLLAWWMQAILLYAKEFPVSGGWRS